MKHLSSFLLNALALITICMIKTSTQLAPSVTYGSSSYSALVGSSLTMTWICTNMQANDVVVRYYMGSIGTAVTIYSSGAYQNGMNAQFVVSIAPISPTNVKVSLTFLNLSPADSAYTYRCQCNEYTTSGCSSGSPAFAADSTLSAYTTTTLTTIRLTTSVPMMNLNGLCIEGSYNTAQYVLIVLTFAILVIATLLFYYPFYGLPYNQSDNRLDFSSVVEIFFLVFIIIMSFFLVIASIIFWINPAVLKNSNLVSTIIVLLGILACLFLWIFILQYVIRLCLNDQIKLVVVIFIAVDGLFEAISAALLLSANVYCSGYSTFPALENFNYSYLEIMGATLLLIFASFLLLIAGVIFFMIKKKKTIELFNKGFDKLPCSSITAASSALSKHGFISELLFIDNKIMPNDTLKQSHANEFSEKNYMPVKPSKLTPIFSRKISEINPVEEVAKEIDKMNGDGLEIHMTESKPVTPIKKFKEKKHSKKAPREKKQSKDQVIPISSNADLQLKEEDVTEATTETEKHEEKASEKSLEKEQFDHSSELSQHSSYPKMTKTTSIQIVQTMPEDPFAYIWDVNNLLDPVAENSSERNRRAKKINGARRAKNDEEKILSSNIFKNDSVLSNSAINSSIVNSYSNINSNPAGHQDAIFITYSDAQDKETNNEMMKDPHPSVVQDEADEVKIKSEEMTSTPHTERSKRADLPPPKTTKVKKAKTVKKKKSSKHKKEEQIKLVDEYNRSSSSSSNYQISNINTSLNPEITPS